MQSHLLQRNSLSRDHLWIQSMTPCNPTPRSKKPAAAAAAALQKRNESRLSGTTRPMSGREGDKVSDLGIKQRDSVEQDLKAQRRSQQTHCKLISWDPSKVNKTTTLPALPAEAC